MKINLARSAGFCFGVKRAIELAMKTAATKKNIYMLGDIVHNEEVAQRMKQAGIKKISRLSAGTNKILLMRAHGSSLKIYKKAASLDYKIVDATCPMVKHIHRIARDMEKKKYRIIIIGDKHHAEVQGILGQLKQKALVISGSNDIPLKKIRLIKNGCVVAQSTQNLKEAIAIVKRLKKHIPKLRFFNTICRPTRLKQQEIRTLPLQNDVSIIIGSAQSANTRRLFQISKSLNNRTYWVNKKEQINKNWFKGALSVGVSTGASTPDSAINDVVNYLKRLH
jgi:4-hydroxy-3-methylbut-2-en-1-yl diphosphate reductase